MAGRGQAMVLCVLPGTISCCSLPPYTQAGPAHCTAQRGIAQRCTMHGAVRRCSGVVRQCATLHCAVLEELSRQQRLLAAELAAPDPSVVM